MNTGKLDYLLQQKIINIGETLNMLRIMVGDEIEVTDRNGKLIKIGTIAIHIQCPWRVVDTCGNFECWRAFKTNSDEKHLFMSGTGLEYE